MTISSMDGNGGAVMKWRMNILTDERQIQDLLSKVRRVAVLGIRSEQFRYVPAFYVPAGLARAGLEIVPVPVYEPDVTQILGKPVYRTLSAVPGEIDLVNVFRRSRDITAHVDDILTKHPRAVWFQSGIRNDEVAEQLARSGILVVQDRCLLSEYHVMRAY